MTPACEYSATVIRWTDGDSVILDIDCGFGMALKSQNVRVRVESACPESYRHQL